ncbi:MAG: TIR domain-containing protein [Proteobacteria bacterium]|nr:TIR domain-containing protein [Pseudomonadota bacterium]
MASLSETGDHRYQAFISYCHQDEKWGVWLHRALEGYRVPRYLVGKNTAHTLIPRRLTPIFRDRDELPTATDLGKVVNEALQRSACLIVICSPHAARSRWVNQEILSFKRWGRSDRILCLIVEGEPNAADKPELEAEECFPEALRYVLGPDGALTDARTEPIAADVRPQGDGKATAKLKLIAGLLGVGLDELKHREQHRRHQRMAGVTAMALGVMVITTVLAIKAIVAEREALQHRAQAEGLISFILGDLREKLEPIGRLDELDSISDKALEYFASLTDKDITQETLAIRSKALRQIGEVRMAQGHLGPAMEAFQRSLSDAELLVQREAENNEALFLLGQAHFWIGYVHKEQGDLDRTLQHLQRYMDVSKMLVEREPENERWQRELGYAYTNLGAVYSARGETDNALEQFLGDQAIGKELVARNPDDLNMQFDLSETTSWVGSALSALGDLDGALEQFHEEVAIKNRLVTADSQNTGWKRRLSLGHRRVGEILEAQGKLNEAIDSFRTALRISENLVSLDPSNANWRRDIGVLRAGMGRIALALDHPEEALINFGNYMRIIETLLAEDASKTRWQRDLADGRILTGNALKVNGHLEDAESAAKKAAEALLSLLSEHPDDREATRLLSEAYLLDGQLLALSGNDEQALAAWLESLELIEPLARATKDYRILNIEAQVLLHLDRIEEASPIVEQLAAMGFANPAFVGLRDSKGLSARAVP